MAAKPQEKIGPHAFTADQIADYKAVFDDADEDGSGSIETAELKSVIEKCGIEVTEAQVAEMIKEADSDGSGTLEFNEFLDLMWKLQQGPSERELRNEMFTLLDDNMDGFVEVGELKDMFARASKETGGKVPMPSEAELKAMVAEVASDGNKISFDDFLGVMEALIPTRA